MLSMPTVEATLSAAVGTQVTITCVPDGEMAALGVTAHAMVGPDGHLLHIVWLKQSDCTALQHVDRWQRHPAAYFLQDGVRVDEAGLSIEIAVHEGEHVALDIGHEGEATVECAAYQNSWQFIRRLKLPRKVDKWLMAGIRFAHLRTPSEYQAQC